MADYINRDSVIELSREYYSQGLKEEAVPVKAIKNIPSADVAEVKHGEWIKARGSWCTPGGDPVWECSKCGKGRHVYGIEHGTYGSDVADSQWVACPNCGADMRKDGGT